MKRKQEIPKKLILQRKDVNVPHKKRNLSLKNSLKPARSSNINTPITSNAGIEPKAPYKNQTNDSCLTDETKYPILTKQNLRLLQKEIFKFETSANKCPHFFCTIENMKLVDVSRLWFLFELEMSINGEINLRNSWYHDQVYRKILKLWPQSNCLNETIPGGYQPLPLQQIILPIPIKTDFEEVKQNYQNLSNEFHFEIASIIDFIPERKLA